MKPILHPGAPFIEVQQLPAETLPFLLPSRYCESDRFTEMAAIAGARLRTRIRPMRGDCELYPR